MKVGDVFKVGGLPDITYIPRDSYHLEKKLSDAIEDRYKIISISGSTKTGKTVLCKRVVCEKNSVWISGADITSNNDFWNLILSKLELPSKILESTKTGKTAKISGSIASTLSSFIASISGTAGAELSTSDEISCNSEKLGRIKENILNLLIETNIILIIDDFHYVVPDLQKEIVRSLKNPIFNGLVVIIISIPHHSYDVINSERELTGRLIRIDIPFWNNRDLSLIAKNGFNFLNIKSSELLISEFSIEAFGNPHLMQEFCLKLCRDNNISGKMDEKTEIRLISDHKSFFNDIAETSSSSHPVFTMLLKGPSSSKGRKMRDFIDGKRGDIYLAMLLAIAKAGPKRELSYWEIRSALKKLLIQIPKKNEISKILTQMSKTAKEIEGEPILEWDKHYETLYISDPFFAFYIKWKFV